MTVPRHAAGPGAMKAGGRAGGARRAPPFEDLTEEEEEPLDPAPSPRRRRRSPRAEEPGREEPGMQEPGAPPPPGLRRRLRRLVLRGVLALIVAVIAVIALFGSVDPPTTPYMLGEARRLGGVEQSWVPLEAIAPAMARSAVAAEDADFCRHWGLDLGAIRAAMAEGSGRGASTISQQVAKNLFLWHGRSWARKALEAALTPAMEALWSKRRILEVYLNVAEFGEGVFGVEAAARHHFGVGAAELSDRQAALLAASLPAPRSRDPARPDAEMERRAARILDGAATIARDGRAACFEGRASPDPPGDAPGAPLAPPLAPHASEGGLLHHAGGTGGRTALIAGARCGMARRSPCRSGPLA